jgi:hypothetical protein
MCEADKQGHETWEKREAHFWEQVKTLNMLIDRLWALANVHYDQLRFYEHLLRDYRVLTIENYLKKQIGENTRNG